jgi:hypothetical protein
MKAGGCAAAPQPARAPPPPLLPPTAHASRLPSILPTPHLPQPPFSNTPTKPNIPTTLPPPPPKNNSLPRAQRRAPHRPQRQPYARDRGRQGHHASDAVRLLPELARGFAGAQQVGALPRWVDEIANGVSGTPPFSGGGGRSRGGPAVLCSHAPFPPHKKNPTKTNP